MPRAEPTYKYLDIPDDMLDAVQLKEKRKERLFKGAHDARERARAAKLVEQRAKVIQRSWPARHRSHTRDEPDARACTGCHTLARRTRIMRVERDMVGDLTQKKMGASFGSWDRGLAVVFRRRQSPQRLWLPPPDDVQTPRHWRGRSRRASRGQCSS